MPATPAVKPARVKAHSLFQPRLTPLPTGGLGVAADGVQVAAEPGAAQQEGPGHHHGGHHQHHVGDALHRLQHPAVGVADVDQGGAGHRHARHLQEGDGHRRGDQAGAPPPAGLQQGEGGVDGHRGDHDDPPGRRAEVAVGDVQQHVVGEPDGPAGAVGVDQVEEDALAAQQAGQGDHEGGEPEPDDHDAPQHPEGGGDGHPDQQGRPPRPVVGRGGQDGGDHRPDAGHVADGQVDLPEDEDPHLGHAQQDEDRPLHQQVGQVAVGEEDRALRLEDDDQDHQAGQYRQHPALAAADPTAPGPEVAAQAVAEVGGLGDQPPWRSSVPLTSPTGSDGGSEVGGGVVVGVLTGQAPDPWPLELARAPVVISSTALWVS